MAPHDSSEVRDPDAAWRDYLRDIGPSPADRARVRRAFERRRHAEVADGRPQPVSRAAAAVLLFKSSATAVGIAACVLGGLAGAARLAASPPAELPNVVDTAPAVAPAATRSGDAAPIATIEPAPATARIEPTVATSSLPDTTPRATVRGGRTSRSTAATATDPAEPASPDTLGEELALIRSAREALQLGDVREAASKLAAHRARFAGGALLDERRALEAIIACNTGASGASALARRFAADRPQSPMLDDVRAACASLSATDRPASAEG